MKWQILFTPTAFKLLSDISDRHIREKIGAVIDRLTEDPEKQGKALLGEFARVLRTVIQDIVKKYNLKTKKSNSEDDDVKITINAILNHGGINQTFGYRDVYWWQTILHSP